MTRSSGQTQSPWTPPAMRARMARPCFPEASRAETGSLACSDYSLARCGPLNIKLWLIGLPTTRGRREVLKSSLCPRKQCGAFPPWGLAGRTFCDAGDRQSLGVSSLGTEPETRVQMHTMHCGNGLRRTCQGEREEEGRKGVQEGRGLGETLALTWATGGSGVQTTPQC